MCLGVPGKIIGKYLIGDLPMGKVDFGGVVREACLAYVPEAEIGDYTVIHVGFAISRLSEQEALESLETIREMISLEEELGNAPDAISPEATAEGI
ncbi:MAG: HypC/HybG/HupF family hydrogenase formation chaperone [Anaerolineae bacterium]